MTEILTIKPAGPVAGTIRPPGSKSITNRSLICAALADGQSHLHGALDSEDTRVMIDSLRRLGLSIQCDASGTQLSVSGCKSQFPKQDGDLFVANSGTSMRFLAAALAAGHGRYRLDGVPRMRQRPIGDLIRALSQLGAGIRSQADNDCPPILIDTQGLAGGTAHIRGNVSSQFLSGLLMAAPHAKRPVELIVDGPLVSKPYVTMTLDVMRAFGVNVSHDRLQQFLVQAPQPYKAASYQIEPDASAASYFWAAAAITEGHVTVDGLAADALQGDVAFCVCLEQMGCQVDRSSNQIAVTGRPLHGINVDMNAISDTVQTLAAVALFADGPTTIRGIAHIRHKETDRIGDLACEVRKLGARVDEFDDGLCITPGALHAAEIETYNDHRMAMSLALVGLRIAGVQIRNPQCTEKTYPRFFTDLATLCSTSRQ